MRKISVISCLSCLIIITSCNNTAGEENILESRIDSATTAASPTSVLISPDSTIQPIQEVTLKVIGNTVEEMAFSKDTLTVMAGAQVKVEFINEGTALPMMHNFVVADSGTYKAVAMAGEKIGSSGNYLPPNTNLLAASPIALPGQTVIVEFNAPLKPATYDFVCTYPEHWKHKHGKLVVK